LGENKCTSEDASNESGSQRASDVELSISQRLEDQQVDNDRRLEKLELSGEITYLFNERASILEFDAGFPRSEAERLAKIDVEAREPYRAWCSLNGGVAPYD